MLRGVLYGALLFCFFPILVHAAREHRFLHLPDKEPTLLWQGWFYNNGNKHEGIDYGCSIGDPIFAAADGIAMASSQELGSSYSYGYFVFIKHDNGYATLYAHLDSIADHIPTYPSRLRANTNYDEWIEVKRGERIGTCGNTGTQAPHLHFELTTGYYATGRVDSYDLYTTSPSYPPNSTYTKLGDKHYWEFDPPVHTPLDRVEHHHEPPLTDINAPEKKNLWQKAKAFVSGLFKKKKKSSAEADTGSMFVQHSDEENTVIQEVAEEEQTPVSQQELPPIVTPTEDLPVEEHIEEDAVVEKDITVRDIVQLPTDIVVETIVDVGDTIEDVVDTIVEEVNDIAQDSRFDVIRRSRNSGGGGSSQNTPIEPMTVPLETAPQEEFGEIIFPTLSYTYPTGTPYVSNTGTLYFGGERNNVVTQMLYNGSGIDATFPSTSTWETFIQFDDGVHEVTFTGQDEDGNSATTDQQHILVDTMAPIVIAPTVEYRDSVSSSLAVHWDGTDHGVGIDQYTVRYRFDENPWIIHTTTTATSTTIPALEHGSYTVAVQAVDVLGHTSGWIVQDNEKTIADWPKTVVINEVAWMGTSPWANIGRACRDHEWIELYNSGTESISVAGWTIEWPIDQWVSKKVPLSGEIEAGGYQLIAKKIRRDYALRNIPIDASWSGRDLSDTGEHLFLKDDTGAIIDELNFSAGWPAGSQQGYYHPMARIDAAMPGSDASNWKTDPGIRSIGDTANCGELYGSPRATNRGLWVLKDPAAHYSTQFIDNIWHLSTEGSPYIFDTTTYIPQGKTLVVEPGVVLIGAHKDAHIDVHGTLHIRGTSEDNVVLTSARDGSLGPWQLPYGMNFDSPNTPASGDWSRLHIHAGGVATIDYADIRYGGNTFEVSSDGLFATKYGNQVIRNEDGWLDVRNTRFSSSAFMMSENDNRRSAVIWTSNTEGEDAYLSVDNTFFNGGYIGVSVEKFDGLGAVTSSVTNSIFSGMNNQGNPIVSINVSTTESNNIVE